MGAIEMTGSARNAMTVDVEDYFQVEAFAGHIRRSDWDQFSCRVEENTTQILELFSEAGTHATFFVLGWVAERYPALIRAIAEEGHEIGSHSMLHRRVSELEPEDFREDARRSKAVLEDTGGQPVKGYRAPTFSIDEKTLWAHEVLLEEGYAYSSSIYPIKHDLYGIPSASRTPFAPRGEKGVVELPITTLEILDKRLPCGGGGYFRLAPYRLSRWAMRRVNSHDQQPTIFYFHPWEIDVGQPRQTGLSQKSRVRHYLNLHKTRPRLRNLLRDFAWGRMDEVFAAEIAR